MAQELSSYKRVTEVLQSVHKCKLTISGDVYKFVRCVDFGCHIAFIH